MNNMIQPKPIRQFAFQIESDGRIKPMVMVKGSAVHEIPKGIYRLNHNDGDGMFLVPENDFKMPERIYGNVNTHAARFLRSFELNDRNLGALLIGEKGSGKTLTLKEVAHLGIRDYEMPTILISTAYTGDALINFLGTITQPIIVGFDEVDKTYGSTNSDEETSANSRQNTLLQILDGAASATKKLFIFSANDVGGISKYMLNRPSRIRYTIHFKNLELDAAVDYVTSNLLNYTEEDLRAYIHVVLADGFKREQFRANKSSNGMNFDSMKELVKEMNQFKGESLNDVMALMQYEGIQTQTRFKVDVYENGELLEKTIGHGDHNGSYLGKDRCEITVKRHVWEVPKEAPTLPEGSEEFKIKVTKEVILTENNFVGFGSEMDMVEFHKDGLQFILRYMPNLDFYEAENTLADALSNDNAEQRKKVAAVQRGVLRPPAP